jgi:chromosome partitioning protein
VSIAPRDHKPSSASAISNERPPGGKLGRVIAIANQKGGVGKTTTAVNLSASIAAAEHRTLLIDCDPQGNTTGAIGFPKDPARRTLYNALILKEPLDRIVLKTQVEGLELIPSDKNLVGAAVELVASENREFHLKALVNTLRDNYQFVIIDCPPALDLLTLNALAAADAVLVPIQCEYLALEGVSELLDTLMRIRRSLNPSLAIEGILLTMYDERTTLSRQVAADLRSFFGQQVFSSLIPRNVRLAEAPSHGKPIMFYDIHSKGADAYFQLAKEVIANEQKRTGQRVGGVDTGNRGSSTDAAVSEGGASGAGVGTANSASAAAAAGAGGGAASESGGSGDEAFGGANGGEPNGNANGGTGSGSGGGI